MTLPSWPEELGRALVDGYAQTRGESRKIARGDEGPPWVRRGRSKSTQSRPVSFFATRDQLARLDRFYVEECQEGALPFLAPDWSQDERGLMSAEGLELLTHDDEPLLITATLVCLFGQPPNAAAWGGHWRVSFELVILP